MFVVVVVVIVVVVGVIPVSNIYGHIRMGRDLWQCTLMATLVCNAVSVGDQVASTMT